MDIVKQYPNMVKEELQRYDFTVCKFYEVDRLHPDVSFRYGQKKVLLL